MSGLYTIGDGTANAEGLPQHRTVRLSATVRVRQALGRG